jgi:hypothetical protein
MKIPMKDFLVRFKKYPTVLTRLIVQHEKLILALLAVAIVVSGSIWYRQFVSLNADTPSAGGGYVEGIVGDQTEVQQLALRLTKVGLFAPDNDGELTNLLVRDWEVNAEKTEYVFWLNKGIDAEEIAAYLRASFSLLGSAEVEVVSDDEITISLPEPNPNLPIILAQPLFDYGPYKLSKTSGKTTIFSRNPREGAVKPYLNKIIVHTYPDRDQLQQALNKGKIDGADSENLTPPNRYTLKTFVLPRYYAVVFNVNKSPFREPALRHALTNGIAPPAGSAFTLTTADQEPNITMAQELIARWQGQGVSVSLELKPLLEIQDRVGPSRTFQALLTGIDYGMDLDPNHIWHSSQIRPPGNNLSGVKDEAIDRQIESVQATLNVAERTAMIGDLHQTLQAQGVALFVRQETASFIATEKMVFQTPWLAQIPADRYRSIARWYLR